MLILTICLFPEYRHQNNCISSIQNALCSYRQQDSQTPWHVLAVVINLPPPPLQLWFSLSASRNCLFGRYWNREIYSFIFGWVYHVNPSKTLLLRQIYFQSCLFQNRSTPDFNFPAQLLNVEALH